MVRVRPGHTTVLQFYTVHTAPDPVGHTVEVAPLLEKPGVVQRLQLLPPPAVVQALVAHRDTAPDYLHTLQFAHDT